MIPQPHHHPTDATLLTYAAGALGEGLALVVACHLAFCAECRSAVTEGEALGGRLLDEVMPELMGADSRSRVLTLLERPPIETAAPKRLPPRLAADPIIPAPLARYLGLGSNEIAWRRLTPGLRQFEVLPRDHATGANLRMLRIAPGARMPRHSHQGTELTIVLSGSYHDELGRFGRGDVAETDPDIVHQPISDLETDCICLIATEAPLRFDNILARVVQRFTGI
jgi:putative transcriptional regulator